MSKRNRLACCGFLCSGLLLSSFISGAYRDPATRLAKDTEFRIPDAVFTVAGGWSAESTSNALVLQTPEGDTRFSVVAETGPNAARAVQAAWKSFSPQSHYVLKFETTDAPLNGWDEHRLFSYDSAPNEGVSITADAYRHGAHWIVLLTVGKLATLEKRSSQVLLLRESLQVAGYQRESFAHRRANFLSQDRVDTIRRFTKQSMEELGIPGISFALVSEGKIVFEGGLGVRRLGKADLVDQNTRFLAASLTKGLTTLLLARLVDKGQLSWDDPVVNRLPLFKLGDAAMTRQILIKHLVCACTGLPRQDLEWEFGYQNATPVSMLKLLGTMQPTSRPGELFQYSNLMAAAAGYVAGYVSNPKSDIAAAYSSAMQKLIFDPLQMNATTFDFDAVQQGNFASPHADDVDGRPAVGDIASNYAILPLAPAGGAWTTSHDLIHYVQLELAEGKLPDGSQLVSRQNLSMRRKPQVRRGATQSYGMGLTIDTTWGVPIFRHGGSMDGYKSELFFIPEANAGAVLLMNSDDGDMFGEPFLRRILEVLYDGRPEAEMNLRQQAQSYRKSETQAREKLILPVEDAVRKQLAAVYLNSALGRLEISSQSRGLTFDFGEWKSAVASQRNSDGTTSLVTIDPTVSGFQFVIARREGKRALILRDSQHEYIFREAPGSSRTL